MWPEVLPTGNVGAYFTPNTDRVVNREMSKGVREQVMRTL
jgi:hypothetical protein